MDQDSRLLDVLVPTILVPTMAKIRGPMEQYWLYFSLLMMSGKEGTSNEFEKILDTVGSKVGRAYPLDVGKTAILKTWLEEI
jgi:hypothetical protein